MKTKTWIARQKMWLIFFVLLLMVGISLLLVRPVRVLITNMQHERAIEEYIEAVDKLSMEELEEIQNKAIAYNASYADSHPHVLAELTGQEEEEYTHLLCVPGTNVMGYVEIPSIDVRLPIYHFATQESFEIGCGHLEDTSLPVSGVDFHTFLMAHRNMPTAVMFENLDKLDVGDTFSVTVLKETMTFEVDDIMVTVPEVSQEVYEKYSIEDGKDYCTLVTCTPYGKTTHRLLVRGLRIS